ncbi:MAG: hypothetical protein AB7H86_20070 [Blastocatellales bacterium]|nr:hypothetical protein [Nitrosomonas nitrosa]
MQKNTAKYFVTASAIILAICGLIMIFSASELSATLFDDKSGSLPIELWGSAIIGFAAMNWIARHSILGGIYGRAVVAGNQVHFFIGSMIMLRVLVNGGVAIPIGILFIIYALHALLFSYLMFWSSGID